MSGATKPIGTRLTLDIRHPNCWAIESTERVGGGVLGHAIYDTAETAGETVNGLFTAYGDSVQQVEELLGVVRASPHAGAIRELRTRFGGRCENVPHGNVVREFFLEYDPRDMICPVLLDHGFVHSAPVRIVDGREYWEVCYAGRRADIEERLDRVREDGSAEVTVSRVVDSNSPVSRPGQWTDRLTDAQREVFERARERGYYEWPRGVSTRELAVDIGVSKTTLLEHLRKAEAKLLDP